jgi:iron complex outermembrane receptor protein
MGPNPNAPSPLLTNDGPIPHTPEFSASGSYEHTFALADGADLTWGVDAHYQAKALTDFDASNYPTANPRFLQKAYTVFNSSLTYSPGDGKYSITGYGRNLANKIYKTAAANGVAGGAFFVNDPRTYGLIFSAKL